MVTLSAVAVIVATNFLDTFFILYLFKLKCLPRLFLKLVHLSYSLFGGLLSVSELQEWLLLVFIF